MQSRITLSEIVDNISRLSASIRPPDFIHDFLMSFGLPKSGNLNVARKSGATLLKTKVYFESVSEGSQGALTRAISDAKTDPRIVANKPRFLMVTDFETLLAFDTKRNETLDFPLRELHEHYAFFLPLAGMERTAFQAETEADVKAAEHMKKLYDLIRADNPPTTPSQRHALNVFLTRLLFCYFAEDTGIFPGEKSFTHAVAQLTQTDGSDLSDFLRELFMTLNIEGRPNKRVSAHLAAFPYVNGGLFNDTSERYPQVPQFSSRSRQKLIDLGTKSWKEINPDIFGSMFQGVVDEEKRAELGMHYTSVPNIMKVIKPLFLDDLYEDLERAKGSEARLNKLLARLSRMRLFDPACGSGNFLIIAYKELRRLEMAVFRELLQLAKQLPLALSGIHVSQFYGIELDDFACEVATLALWLAEHQMNLECKAVFGQAPPSLPLRAGANIVCGNATRLDWDRVCPSDDANEVFLMGNPPYYGARNQSPEQKNDVRHCFDGAPEHKDADYICCWFIKGARYVATSTSTLAFVTTNSICQGDHIVILWPRLLNQRLEIGFAHSPFKWSNSAKAKAGVTCVIIGLRRVSTGAKWIYSGALKTVARNINPYLADAENVLVGRRQDPLTERPSAVMGSMARDGGFLILSKDERQELLGQFPSAAPLIRVLVGTKEFIDGPQRWCLWISNENLPLARSIPPVATRISEVLAFRTDSTAKTTNGYASISHQFAQRAHREGSALMIPRVSSERRVYIPMAFFTDGRIISDSAHAIYGAPLWLFGIMSSKMHMVWAHAVAGGLEMRIRYSTLIVYNNFPLPHLDPATEETLTRRAEDVLLERERHPGKGIADLYDPDTMPADLLTAHRALDEAVERLYRVKSFTSDQERLAYLFGLYAEAS